MRHRAQFAGTVLFWAAAILVAIASARYFFPALLRPSEVLLVRLHPFWVQLHLGGAIVATVAGLPQFVAALRNSRPAVHRSFGYVYVIAVLLSGIAGMWLSPDTARFLAEGFRDGANDPAFRWLAPLIGVRPGEAYSDAQFTATIPSFFLLAVAWLITTGMAFTRARQRCFTDHRAWMMRSYSLTFGAFTVRIVAIALGLLTRAPVFSAIAALWSWPLNLLVAEWLIRRKAQPALAMRAARAGG